jgi:hypothetical protein
LSELLNFVKVGFFEAGIPANILVDDHQNLFLVASQIFTVEEILFQLRTANKLISSLNGDVV